MTTNEAPTAAEHPLLALARSASALLSSISAYPTSKSPSPDVAEELMSIVAITSSLLIALNSSLDQRLGWKSQSSPFVGPLCREIEAGLGEVRKKVDEGRKKNCGSVEKSLEWKPLVLGGEQEVTRLKMRLLEGRMMVGVLVEGLKLMSLRSIAEGERTPEQKAELGELEAMLPSIVENLLGVQKSFGMKMSDESGEVEEGATDMNPTEKDIKEIPDLAADIEDLKMLHTKSHTTIASAASSVTVIDDSIEEAWLLRRNVPKKTLKNSTNIFGVNVASFYKHEDVSAYYVKPLQTCAEDIEDIRARAIGNSSEHEHQASLKKIVLGLEDKAQWEIQRLVESRDRGSSNENVRRLWEVVAFQTQPRRKISDTSERKSWWRAKEPLVEWVMILRGVTIDHQKRTTPVKLGDPWKAKENANNSTVEAIVAEPDVPTVIEKKSMTIGEAKEKIDSVLAVLFTPAVDLVDTKEHDSEKE